MSHAALLYSGLSGHLPVQKASAIPITRALPSVRSLLHDLVADIVSVKCRITDFYRSIGTGEPPLFSWGPVARVPFRELA